MQLESKIEISMGLIKILIYLAIIVGGMISFAVRFF